VGHGSGASGAKVGAREELRATVRGAGLVVRSSPPLALGLLALTIAGGAAPALVVAQTGRFLAAVPDAIGDGAASAAGREVRSALVLIAVAVFASQIIVPLSQALLYGVQKRFEAYLARRLMTATTSLPGIAHFEDPSFRDQLEVAHWIGFGPVHTLQFASQLVQQLSQLVAMAAVAATYAGWVPALVIAASVPGGLASWHYESMTGLSRWRRSDDARRADYYRDLAVQRESAKELRVFSLSDWVLGRQAASWLASVRELWAVRRRSLLVALALRGLAVVALVVAYWAMLSAAVDGRVDVGRFTAASIATVGLVNALGMLFREASRARRSSFYLPAAVRVLDLPRLDPRLPSGGTRAARSLDGSPAQGAARALASPAQGAARALASPAQGAARALAGIRFEGVSFTYPGTAHPVLRDLDLWIPARSSVALVGENGAGKTTLIKLLCRLYDPDQGRILLDGVDLREFDLASLRSRMAVVFQDFVRYHLPARDNVGFGAVERAGEQDLLAEAARRVGALALIEGLPRGWDTPLAREFGGVDLSGGEWQRVALARAMMAQIGRDADILVLDEPTASLDVRVEHELYEHFNELSRDRTTLLVSHRFSTVRMAERIVLLGEGRVVEDGSHEALMAAGGRYAGLYEVQASHYRLTGRLE
jgi:ABC-type multidrug transport system fused ATPase/permease subunit